MTMHSSTFPDLLDSIAAKTPSPGGGAVAAATGALAAALARMVVSYSLGKKNLAEHWPLLEAAAGALDRAGPVFLELAEEDAMAFERVSGLLKLPEGDPARAAEMPAAVELAIAAPRSSAAAACDLLRLLERLCGVSNRNLRSDLAVAAVLAEAAARSSFWNVRANLWLLPEVGERAALSAEADSMLAEAAERRRVIEERCG